MNRRVILVVLLTLAVAAASLWNLVSFRLEHLMRPSWPELTLAAWYAAFAVILVAAAVALWSRRLAVFAAALVVVLAASALPRIADRFAAPGDQPVAEVDGTGAAPVEQPPAPPPQPEVTVDLGFGALLRQWSETIAAREAAGAFLSPEESYDFLAFVASPDSARADGPEQTARTFALMREALASGVLDPDALTTAAPVADSPAVTLTLLWYDREIRPGAPDAIPRHAWQVLAMLVEGGADIASDAAADLRADLAKTVIDNGGRFIGLAWGEIPPPAESIAAPPLPDSGAE